LLGIEVKDGNETEKKRNRYSYEIDWEEIESPRCRESPLKRSGQELESSHKKNYTKEGRNSKAQIASLWGVKVGE